MIKNKKSLIVIEAIIKLLILLAVITWVIVPLFNKAHDALFDPEQDYINSFNSFVEWVNFELGVDERDDFELEIGAKRAVVGFSKDADRFECINCWDKDKTLVYDKPFDDEECQGTACICLCRDEFKFKEIEFSGKKVKSGSCDYTCKALNPDIVTQTVTVNSRSNTNIIWNNGFLFASLLPLSNGLVSSGVFTKRVYVDKTQDTISVCNDEMLEHNVNIGIDGCTGSGPPIPVEIIERGEEAIREFFLNSVFDGFVNLVNELEMRVIDPSVTCNKVYDLTGFDNDKFITYEKVGDKGKISLKRGQSHDEIYSEEVDLLVPYLILQGAPAGSLNLLFTDEFIQDEKEDFNKYLLRPYAESGRLNKKGHLSAIFGNEKKAVFIHKNGNWVLTTNHEIVNLANEIGGLCWT